MSASDFEHQARMAKARKLADKFIACDVDVDTISYLDDAGWNLWAEAAGVRTPSVSTRMMVIGLVAQASVKS